MPTIWAPWPGNRKAILGNGVCRVERVWRVDDRPAPPVRGSLCGCDDRATHVVTAIGTDHVRGNRGAALGAILELARFLEVMRPPRAGPGVGMLAFGDSHVYTCAGAKAARAREPSLQGNGPS